MRRDGVGKTANFAKTKYYGEGNVCRKSGGERAEKGLKMSRSQREGEGSENTPEITN